MFKQLFAVALLSFSGLSVAACAGSADGVDDTASTDEEIISGSMCGGIAALQCPQGYDCKLAGNYPDASGTCRKSRIEGHTCGGFVMNAYQCPTGYSCIMTSKTPDMPGKCHKDVACVQKVMCMVNAHFDTSLCQCVNNVTCKTLTCAGGYHCEMKGINGGSIGACIKN